MCLIICHESGKVPTEEMLRSGQASNSDGIGLAWKYMGEVYFRKGIEIGELLARVKWIGRSNIPYIVHFRIATAGARVPALCHPFPITFDTEKLFSLKGRSKAVMAHNGTWMGWREAVGDNDLANKIGSNNWSDSAVMAWLLSQKKVIKLSQFGYGHRVAVLSGKRGLDLYGNFSTDPSTGIHYSNRSWQWGSTRRNYYSGMGTAGYRYPYGVEPEELEFEDQCALPAPVAKETAQTIPTKGPVHPIHTTAKADIVDANGKRWRFQNDGGWVVVED